MKANAVEEGVKAEMTKQVLLELLKRCDFNGESELVKLAETSAKMVNRMIETLHGE